MYNMVLWLCNAHEMRRFPDDLIYRMVTFLDRINYTTPMLCCKEHEDAINN